MNRNHFYWNVEVKRFVTVGLPADEVEALSSVVGDESDIHNESIRTEVSYSISATMQLSIPEATSKMKL